MTSGFQVRRPNHSATLPPCIRFQIAPILGGRPTWMTVLNFNLTLNIRVLKHQIEINIFALQELNPKNSKNVFQNIGRQQGTVSISCPSSLNTSQANIKRKKVHVTGCHTWNHDLMVFTAKIPNAHGYQQPQVTSSI